MVRLKAKNLHDASERINRFNSKMVRLKVYLSGVRPAWCKMFQFQNGTIKSQLIFNAIFAQSLFQFQNGTIKSLDFGINQQVQSKFQFQNGTIKSRQ